MTSREEVPGAESVVGGAVGLRWWTTEPRDAGAARDYTNPYYYFDKAAYWREQVMRAELAGVYEMRQAAQRADTDAEIDRLLGRAAELSAQWRGRDDALGRAWIFAQDAIADWTRSPDTMRRLLDDVEFHAGVSGGTGLAQIDVRSLYQARELTGNGTWVTVSAPSPDAARHTPLAPVPEFGSRRVADGALVDTDADAASATESSSVAELLDAAMPSGIATGWQPDTAASPHLSPDGAPDAGADPGS